MRSLPILLTLCLLAYEPMAQALHPNKNGGDASALISSCHRIKLKIERLQRAYHKANKAGGSEVSSRQTLGLLEVVYEHEIKKLVAGLELTSEANNALQELTELASSKRVLTSSNPFPFTEAARWVTRFSAAASALLELIEDTRPGTTAGSTVDTLSARRGKPLPGPRRPRLQTPQNEDRAELPPTIDDSLLEPIQREVLAFTDQHSIPAFRKIMALQGMTAFKRFATDVVIDSRFRDDEAMHGTYHCAFVGSPGTGKTTVARLYGALLFELGLLGQDAEGPKFTEVSRTDLVGAHIGETEKKTGEFLRASLGGVLFIDEAHNLGSGNDNSKDFGHRAVNVINKFMEDERGRLVVVFAGYTEQMEAFINEDPGLRSRISRVIEFADLNPQELLAILANFYKGQGLSFEHSVLERAAALLAAERQREEDRGKHAFANGRAVRNLFERSLFAQKRRLFSEYHGDIAAIGREARAEIKACDLE